MKSSSTGSTGGCRAENPSSRADAGALSGRVRRRRARRRADPLRGLRHRRADCPAHADVVDHPLAALEDADPVPRAALPRARVRRSWQRPLRPAVGARRVSRGGVRCRRARGDGCNRYRARRAGVALTRCGAVAPHRRRPPRADREAWSSSRRHCPCHRWCHATGRPQSSASPTTTTTGGGSGTATTGSSITRSSSSSSSRSASPSPTPRSRVRTRSAGVWTRTPRRWSRHSSHRG